MYLGWEYIPNKFDFLSFYTRAFEFQIFSTGLLGGRYNGPDGIRPVISLSSKVKLTGDGTYNNIYTVS